MTVTTHHMIAKVRGADLRTTLAWDSADPFAVRMVMHAKKPVEWVFAWELLAEGRFGEVGDGDIQIRPAGDGWVEIELTSPHGHALLTFDDGDIWAFLDETWCAEATPISDEDLVAFLAGAS